MGRDVAQRRGPHQRIPAGLSSQVFHMPQPQQPPHFHILLVGFYTRPWADQDRPSKWLQAYTEVKHTLQDINVLGCKPRQSLPARPHGGQAWTDRADNPVPVGPSTPPTGRSPAQGGGYDPNRQAGRTRCGSRSTRLWSERNRRPVSARGPRQSSLSRPKWATSGQRLPGSPARAPWGQKEAGAGREATPNRRPRPAAAHRGRRLPRLAGTPGAAGGRPRGLGHAARARRHPPCVAEPRRPPGGPGDRPGPGGSAGLRAAGRRRRAQGEERGAEGPGAWHRPGACSPPGFAQGERGGRGGGSLCEGGCGWLRVDAREGRSQTSLLSACPQPPAPSRRAHPASAGFSGSLAASESSWPGHSSLWRPHLGCRILAAGFFFTLASAEKEDSPSK